ncbi:glycosyltransferase family 2 protein [Cetobacterium somerae]|uniref:glycosyltransferase family 2 protein n=1 Tax=Cetobacterium somerae TaxID=188913 RepID=UPI003D7699A0
MDIKVSVIVPAYNVEKYIGKCLDSLINQTLKEIEIIVVNDGSTDSTEDIIEIYSRKDSRIKYINQENMGSSQARNRGLKEASGKYVGYVDSDDYVELNYYEDMFCCGEKNKLDIVISNFIKEIKDSKEIKEDFLLKENKFISGKEYIENIFLGNGYPNVWDKIALRSLYEKGNIKFERDIFLGDDIIVTVMLGYFAEKVGKLNKAYVHYVQHENQGTSKSGLGNKINDLYLVCEKLEKFFQKEKYVSKNFNWYRLNEFFLKFLTCYPMETKNYLKAKSNFILGLNEILKIDELKKLKSKHRLRLKICKYLGDSKYLDTYLKLKNRKRG